MWFILDNVFNHRNDYVASVLASIETIENEQNLKAEFEKRKNFFAQSPLPIPLNCTK